jgi:hypothetical protein
MIQVNTQEARKEPLGVSIKARLKQHLKINEDKNQ